MKRPSNQIIFSLTLLTTFFWLCIAGCKKDDSSSSNTDQNNNGNTPTGMLMFHLHTYLDNNEVDGYGFNYTMDDGRKVSLSLAQFYIMDIQLVKLDGSTYNVTGKKLLKVLDTDIYTIGEVPVGNYKSIRFKVGLDSATNLADPSTSPDSAILNHSEMWFGSTAQAQGYVFMNVQGMIDTTANASGTVAQMQPFSYKIGTNSHYIQVNMPEENYTVVQGQAQYVHVLMDYYALFHGINLTDPTALTSTTAAANDHAPATIIANNISAAFRYEE